MSIFKNKRIYLADEIARFIYNDYQQAGNVVQVHLENITL
jgi:hypothetical protein